MIGTSASAAFWVDDTYDRDMSSDGRSRFGAYLRQKAGTFTDEGSGTDNIRFALAAWRIAQPPIMSPGYVRWHPRVVDNCEHWDDEGRVSLTIELATPLPTQVARTTIGLGWAGWERYGERWIEPYDNDCPAAFATLTIRVPLPSDLLPSLNCGIGTALTHRAQSAVRSICGLINSKLEPVLVGL